MILSPARAKFSCGPCNFITENLTSHIEFLKNNTVAVSYHWFFTPNLNKKFHNGIYKHSKNRFNWSIVG